MSAVDVPPGLAIGRLAAGELAAVPRAHKLARRSFVFVTLVGAATWYLAARRFHAPFVEFLFVVPLVCFSVAAVGYAVRAARLRIDRDGVRWGWRIAGFRMHRDRIDRVRVFADAVALTPTRGSTWYLSRRDWNRFERMVPALEAAAIPFERHRGRAPLAAKLQGYGLVLDTLLAANLLVATLTLFAAFAV